MGQPYIGEIRLFGGNFAPVGWAFCNGQLVPISENDALFTIIGTTYGGDGQETFALPNLQSRVPIHQGNGFTQGEMAGVESVTLSTQQIPNHTHGLQVSSGPGAADSPEGRVLATPPVTRMFIEDVPTDQLAPAALAPTGGSQPHTNLQPYVCISYIIALFGVFPSQT
jgi:microcystin-dependent protein